MNHLTLEVLEMFVLVLTAFAALWGLTWIVGTILAKLFPE